MDEVASGMVWLSGMMIHSPVFARTMRLSPDFLLKLRSMGCTPSDGLIPLLKDDNQGLPWGPLS